ncbi:S41 family peptidase [Aurantibacter sp.]|uniref:S41 family peptidase n=1 Tax=Aurantibacter sp. TaxID=2807103 RepID=UPI0035C7EA54
MEIILTSMNPIKTLRFYGLLFLLISSCAYDLDDNPVTANDINDFIYKGLRTYYLYNELVPDLVENKTFNPNYNNYLSANTPENFFENLIYDRAITDKFSWLTSDYLALEQQFQGTNQVNGMVYGLDRVSPGSDNLYGYVKYVLPNTSASSENLMRGAIFTQVDNQNLTISNYRSLLDNSSYSIQLAAYNSITNEFDVNGTTINLTKQTYTENPIYKSEIFTIDSDNVGYLMYNRFNAEFDEQLNNEFGNFAANNIDHLVLDLRYNPGGSVNTATRLASMITGQFNTDVFSKLNYNSNNSASNQTYNFSSSINGQTINHLNLTEVYVLTTDNTASASEMIINSLRPYINVIQIGTTTVGKSQASITLYDSSNFSRNNVNPLHLYAMQPLVAKTTNKLDVDVPSTGLVPNIVLSENALNLNELGQITEPLLAEALAQIDANNRIEQPQIKKEVSKSIHSTNFFKFNEEMFIDHLSTE